MDRRKFIEVTSLGGMVLFLPSMLPGCTGKRFVPEELLGKPDKPISAFKKEGNVDFAYYIIPRSRFKHAHFNGQEAFIFSEKGLVQGFTIRAEGEEETENCLNELAKLYKSKTLYLNNEFGKGYLWEVKGKTIKLCYTRETKNLPAYTFYSEHLPGTKLVVF